MCVVCQRRPYNSEIELRRQDLKQLKKRMTFLVQENRMLESNIHDAEAALRTSARYEFTQLVMCYRLLNVGVFLTSSVEE